MPDTDQTAVDPLAPQPPLLTSLSQQRQSAAQTLAHAFGLDTAWSAARGQLDPEEAKDFALSALPALAIGPEERAAQAATGAVEDLLPGAQQMIRAYHGSPYDFERFDISKIGTGEGAQAYGHGLYFAENPEVAAEYRKRLSGPDTLPSKQPAPKPGKTYEVGIKASPDDFLHLDAPFSQQSKKVQETLRPFVEDQMKQMRAARDQILARGTAPGSRKPLTAEQRAYYQTTPEPTGGKIYDMLQVAHGAQRPNQKAEEASKWLKDRGIQGIRYLDQGSRGKDPSTGTHNYIVFDDKMIDIVRKYGIAGLIAGAGGGVSMLGTREAQAGEIKPPLQVDPLLQDLQQNVSEFTYDEHGNLVRENKGMGSPGARSLENLLQRQQMGRTDPKSAAQTKPWEAEGMGRTQWFLRKAGKYPHDASTWRPGGRFGGGKRLDFSKPKGEQ